MRLLLAGLILCATALSAMVIGTMAAERLDDAGDLYLEGFQAWQKGQQLSTEGAKVRDEAIAKLKEAEAKIADVQKLFPDWNPGVAQYRLDQIRARLAELVPPERPAIPAVPDPPPVATKPLMPTVKPPPMYFDRTVVPFEFNGRTYFKMLLSHEAAAQP
jgi:hypothetical protein